MKQSIYHVLTCCARQFEEGAAFRRAHSGAAIPGTPGMSPKGSVRAGAGPARTCKGSTRPAAPDGLQHWQSDNGNEAAAAADAATAPAKPEAAAAAAAARQFLAHRFVLDRR